MPRKTPEIKICGLTNQDGLHAALDSRADYAGFVFYDKSPRYISYQTAATLSQMAKNKIKRVGLFVNPTDEELEKTLHTVELDFIQLHGNETPERAETIRGRFGMPIIKALPVANKGDVKTSERYFRIIDIILFDTKDDKNHGGTGRKFDWSLLDDFVAPVPWMLAGGLNKDNIEEALSLLSPDMVDISSGVENAPGIKNARKIKEFIAQVRKTR